MTKLFLSRFMQRKKYTDKLPPLSNCYQQVNKTEYSKWAQQLIGITAVVTDAKWGRYITKAICFLCLGPPPTTLPVILFIVSNLSIQVSFGEIKVCSWCSFSQILGELKNIIVQSYSVFMSQFMVFCAKIVWLFYKNLLTAF